MVLPLFCAALLVCLLLKLSILWALVFGLLLFLLHGRRQGLSRRELLSTALEGVRTVRNILLTFLVIGVMTALWRMAGTIPVLVCYASRLIRPEIFLLMCFLLNCLLSLLTGTSFGTTATMGVVCAAMGAAMGVDMRLVGGAVLSGAYFGDRCSPVSTSALLVAELTGTVIFDNIRRMLRTALVPFLLSCAVYALLGLRASASGAAPDLDALFGREFVLAPLSLLPAAVILILSLLRVPVRPAMAASILCAVPLCLFVQRRAPAELLSAAFTGFRAFDAEVAAMLDGGGILSMLNVGAIVLLSASYSGLFEKTGLLGGARERIRALAARTNSFAALAVTALLACAVSCNQSLSTMLCAQLCGGLYPARSDLALDLEDSVVVIAALLPWSIACSVPLTMVGAPASAVCAACYLYLLPLWRLLTSRLAAKGQA